MAALPQLFRRGPALAAPKRRAARWVIAALVLVFGPGLWHLARMAWQQRRLDQQLAQLAAERSRLQIERQRLQTDATYVEGRIRETFKVARPGELVIPIDRLDGD